MARQDPTQNWQTSDPLITHHLWSGTNAEGTKYNAVVCDLPDGAAYALIEWEGPQGKTLLGTRVCGSVLQAKHWVEWIVLDLHAEEFIAPQFLKGGA